MDLNYKVKDINRNYGYVLVAIECLANNGHGPCQVNRICLCNDGRSCTDFNECQVNAIVRNNGYMVMDSTR